MNLLIWRHTITDSQVNWQWRFPEPTHIFVLETLFVSFQTSLIKVTLLNISNADLPVSFCIFFELTHKHICINDPAWHVASAGKHEPCGCRGPTVRGHFHARLGQRFDLTGSKATWLVCGICLICMLTWRGCGAPVWTLTASVLMYRTAGCPGAMTYSVHLHLLPAKHQQTIVEYMSRRHQQKKILLHENSNSEFRRSESIWPFLSLKMAWDI